MEERNGEDVTVMFIGETGSGKSSVANVFLKEKFFEESEKPYSCTSGPKYHRSVVNGCGRIAIDTEDFNDGLNTTDEQIHKLAKFMKSFDQGISAIAIVIPGCSIRFNQNVRDIIKFIYESLGNEVLSHFCIIFTYCKENFPDRQVINTEYKKILTEFLSEISGDTDISNIPMYFVNCAYPDKDFVVSEMTQFYDWASMKKKMRSQDFEEVPLGYSVEEETETGHSLGLYKEGENTIERFVDRKRNKIIPNDGSKITYSDWVVTREYTELVIKVETEEQKNQHHSFEYKDGNKYEILVDLTRKVSLDLRTGRTTESPWGEVNRTRRLISKSTTSEEVIESKEYIPSANGYKLVTCQKKRQIYVDPDGKVSYGDYSVVPDSISEKKVEIQLQRVVETERRVSKGILVNDNKKFEKFIDRKRTVTIPNNGSKPIYSEWETIRSYEELIEESNYEWKRHCYAGYECSRDTRYKVYCDMYRTVTYNLRTGKKTYSDWTETNKRREYDSSRRRLEQTDCNETLYDEDSREWRYKTTYLKREKITDFDGRVSYTDWKEYKSPTYRHISKPSPQAVTYTRYHDDGCILI